MNMDSIRNIRALLCLAVIIAEVCTSCCKKQGHNEACVSAVAECEITAPLDSLLDSLFRPEDPGAVMVIVRGDSVVYDHAVGVANFDTGMRLTDTTLMNSCSLTKGFVMAAVLKLQREGRLSLEDTLTEFFPTFNKDVFGKLTVRHIVNHTTGLPDRRPRNPNEWNTYLKLHESTFGDSEDYLLYANEDEMVRFYETVDHLENEPGTKFAYQEPPFLLLGCIIEQVSGMPLEDYININFIEPFGLVKTCFFDSEKNHDIMAHGYVPAEKNDQDAKLSRDGRWAEFDYGESPFFGTHPDHGILTTGKEYARWQKALYSGEVVPLEDLRNIYNELTTTRVDYVSYGYATFVSLRDGYPVKPFRISYNGGFSVAEGVFPEQHIYYVILSNRPDWKRLAVSEKVDDILRSKGWI